MASAGSEEKEIKKNKTSSLITLNTQYGSTSRAVEKVVEKHFLDFLRAGLKGRATSTAFLLILTSRLRLEFLFYTLISRETSVNSDGDARVSFGGES